MVINDIFNNVPFKEIVCNTLKIILLDAFAGFYLGQYWVSICKNGGKIALFNPIAIHRNYSCVCFPSVL